MSAPQSVSPRRRSRLLSASSWFVALVLVLTPALAGCDQASAKKTASSEATTAQTTIEVPDVVGLKGDAAVDALEKAGLTEDPTFKDVDGKESVWKKSNWSVTAQDPAAGEQVAADREITLTVTHDSAHAEASAKASASAAAAAEAAEKAAQEKAAQEAQQAEEAAQEQAQEPEEPAQPAQKPQAYYRNCAEAKAAGAAPLYQGDPGYRSALDRDHDGVACEK
ncbi:excalibur calcium-binding domain-containing protein [Actinomyces sp. HMT897]|uniref:excalibur calcium-binding domain-containing protein n=1 Tax=Actinomyces sp. HMT897 TaxID=2789424 RepID=UPI001FF05DF2|nr:excalibur calcium-binding domain-containing protein [Actinomyces sp. HMT897]